MKFLVTVKLPKNIDHDPFNKKTGSCPVNPEKSCSDVTGEHHTFIWEESSVEDVELYWKHLRGHHVTRIEEV